MDRVRKDVIEILRDALFAVHPFMAMNRNVAFKDGNLCIARNSFPVSKNKTYVVGAGKASAHMAQALERILGDNIEFGIVNTKYGHSCKTKRIKINECGHPLPDKNSLEGTNEIVDFLKERKKDDIVIALISGGGSSLLAKPEEGMTLQDKIKTTELLLKCGASINDMNCVRKHISAVKGGRLGALTEAKVVSLIMSDVVGDEPSVIASGPFTPDATTFSDAFCVVERHGLSNRIPISVLNHIKSGMSGKHEETPKKANAKNFVIARNHDALKAAERKARKLGYDVMILSSFIEGESRQAAKFHTQIALQILETGEPLQKPACLISGGETTVIVKGKGKGGPNCEFVLSAALEIRGKPITVAAIDTDGGDFTDAAGAIADGKTVKDLEEARRFLENNNSYAYLRKRKRLLFTGPTGTNVNDLRVVIVGKAHTHKKGKA